MSSEIMGEVVIGEVVRKYFDECMIKNNRAKITTFEEYIEYRNKIIYAEMKECGNGQNEEDVVNAILKAQNRVLSELNKRLALSPYNQDFDELLLDSITEIFCKNFRYEKNDFISKVYYKGGGTSPMVIKDEKIQPVSTPCSRLHNWICRQKIDIKEISRIFAETKDIKDCNGNGLQEVLNGQCDITLEVLWRMFAVPLHLDNGAFNLLAYEVLQDTVNYDSLVSICTSQWYKYPNQKNPPLKSTGNLAHPKTKNRPTICIIGASGFIGTNLIRKMGNRYQLVLQFHKPPTKEMVELIPNDALIYVGDLRNEELTKRIFLENNIDFAFWLAAKSTQSACADYLDAYDMNVNHLKCLFYLLGAKIITLKGLLLPSTCLLYMYDTSDKTIYRETDSLICDNLNNNSNSYYYAKTKLRLENFALDIAKSHDVNIIIARMSQIYGPGDTSTRLIPTAIDSMSNNRPLKCSTNQIGNSPCVNFIHIDDVVNAFINICESAINETYDFNKCRIINLAGTSTYTVLEVLGILKDVFNSNVEIQKNEIKDLNVKIYAINTSLAEKEIDFKPQISLKKGLTKLRNYLSSKKYSS